MAGLVGPAQRHPHGPSRCPALSGQRGLELCLPQLMLRMIGQSDLARGSKPVRQTSSGMSAVPSGDGQADEGA